MSSSSCPIRRRRRLAKRPFQSSKTRHASKDASTFLRAIRRPANWIRPGKNVRSIRHRSAVRTGKHSSTYIYLHLYHHRSRLRMAGRPSCQAIARRCQHRSLYHGYGQKLHRQDVQLLHISDLVGIRLLLCCCWFPHFLPCETKAAILAPVAKATAAAA